jgi:Amt family ammonium transporter
MNIAGRKLKLFTVHVDDALGITHTHMVAGTLGGFLTGLFATTEGCAAFALTNPGGAIDGNGKQVWLQIVGALFIIGWNLVWVSIIMCFIKYVCRVDLRLSEDKLMLGDGAVHGEVAYCFDEDVIGMPRAASDAMLSGRANISNHRTIEGRDLEKGSDDAVAPEVGQSSKHQDSKID